MKINKLLTLLFLLITVLLICSCVDDSNNNTSKKYKIIWQNYNGEVLETDIDVEEGTIPIYNGETPIKASDNQIIYVFNGWNPVVEKVYKDTIYQATFIEKKSTYTVTWQNYNGEILEIDNNASYGSMPSYDGKTPVKDANGEITYVFNGWTPTISKVDKDITYTALFKEIYDGKDILGINPKWIEEGKILQYGLYPQTNIKDETLIKTLSTLTSSTNGWYLYEGTYYTKETAKVYNNENYTFDDGSLIENGKEYWFKCEPINWQVLENKDGSYFLLSTVLLDTHNYHNDYVNRQVDGKTIFANNYQESSIRNWLNNEFYNTAFSFNNTYIIETIVDNSSLTSNDVNNIYACTNTVDKVYLPSYQDYLNLSYGFDSDSTNKSTTRYCKTTDYARARGAWCNVRDDLGTSSKYNGTYWTRTASSKYYYTAWNINSGGFLSQYAVDGKSHCIRPCININL